MDDKHLAKLRAICLALPDTTETATWGHPNFRVSNKIFCAYEVFGGELSMCFKVGKEMQGVFLEDTRFYKTPYVGQHGWVSLKVAAGKVNWKEVKELCEDSYRRVRPQAKAKKAAR